MNNERIVIAPFEYTQDGNKTNMFKVILVKYLYHWPLFVLGVALALIGAFIYTQYIDPTYTITAKLLISDDKKESSVDKMMQKMDVFESSKVIDNESEILQSRTLLARVINDLNLYSTYSKPGKFRDVDIYDNTPVQLRLLNQTSDHFNTSFTIRINNANEFTLVNKDENDKTFKFSDGIKNSFGSWRLEKTANFNKYIGKEIHIATRDTEQVVNSYVNKIKSSRLNKLASVIELSLQDNVLQRGRDILLHTVAAYNDQSVKEKKRSAENALLFINSRLKDVSGELSSVEKSFEGFRSQKGLTDVSSEAKLYLENVKSNDTQLSEINVQLDVINGIERYVRSSLSVNSAPATIGISDPGLSALVRQLMDLQAQRDKLLATTPEKNPIFEPVNRQIASTKASILNNISGIKSSLSASKRQLLANSNRFESSIKNIPGQERQFINIKRQQTNKENLYVYLLQKREEAALSYASTINDSRLIDYTYVKSSSKKIIYIIAFMLGIFVPLGIIYCRDSLNDRVNTRTDISSKTTVPILGELVYHEGKHPLVIGKHNQSNFEISEQFRVLRTNLHFIHATRQRGRVTLLTSSIANEGKSFVTSNLGVTLAVSGRKTIILELDLRKPKIHENFKLNPYHKGLSDYIEGTATINEIIQPSNYNDNLFVITAGTATFNPSELLEQQQVDMLLDDLRGIFDDILLDTPPINIVTDAMVLSRVSDVTLYVIRQGLTKAWELEMTEKLFKQHQIPKMNIVFNGVRKDKYSYAENHNYARYGYTQEVQEYTAAVAIKSILKRF
ncbi:polysaccharide biosynthesis tyrosine autokinase [Mucilaginibacter sp. Bleaf8]|uniref:GumC family protein n=1 Tax=Mucilaginibacter sp. Bleaf8 TaxID=2834430 RepID=UPI001BD0855E|nr:tyrosine-protein kinase [Mucilaginibacter sp. Bleaf8]MBS7566823.1 polysaccharide biosynthesis tyrosine autokinase [Mucilaginibacter sp. Bleaf8]